MPKYTEIKVGRVINTRLLRNPFPLSAAEHGAGSTGIARGLFERSEFRSARAGCAARRGSAAIAGDSDAGCAFCCLLIFSHKK